MVKFIAKIPVWALPAIINGDSSGLEQEDVDTILAWFEKTGVDVVECPTDKDMDKKYFTSRPAFGKACEVVKCKCIIY